MVHDCKNAGCSDARVEADVDDQWRHNQNMEP
jgi:hypothetical protein